MRPRAAGSRAAASSCRFCLPVRWPWNRGSSTIAPTRANATSRCRGTAWPSSDISPASACVSPRSTRIKVVLPAPLGPRYPNAQPRGIRRSTLLTATVSPNLLVSPLVSTAHRLSLRTLDAVIGILSCLGPTGFAGGTGRGEPDRVSVPRL
jgi:hypothetical protein